MNCTLKQAKNKSFIMLEGELTLPHAEELKTAFVLAFANADCVSVTLERIQDVDLSFLQLLCSAHQSAMCSEKRLNIEGCPPQILKDILDASGYFRHTGCTLVCKTSCWIATAGQLHE